jgi:hypothetical protein
MRPYTSGYGGRQVPVRLVTTLATTLLLVAALVVVSSARADGIAITPGSFATTLSTYQAGAHPDLITTFGLDHDSVFAPLGGTPRDIAVALPPGLVGAANATPTCPMGTVANVEKACPIEAAVGEVDAKVYYPPSLLQLHELVYNVTPSPDEPAAFGFSAVVPVRLDTSLRSDGDYGITARSTDLTEGGSLIGASVKLWGVPADHNGPSGTCPGPTCSVDQNTQRPYGGPSQSPRRAFLTNPSECSGSSLTASLSIDAWQNAGVFTTASFGLPLFTGCEKLAFAPTVDIRPDNKVAGAPAGLAVDIAVPQNADPDGLATADVKEVSVALPVGMAVSASSADGLGGCSDEQIALHELGVATCPDSSKIGTVEVTTPLLDHPLEGEVFLGTQKSNDPQSGEMFRLFVQIAGFGVRVKLPGQVRADPATGQLTATFADNPQVPFSAFSVRFKGGARAPLVNPTSCGIKTAQATLTSWADPTPIHSDSSFAIDQGCDRAGRFEPSLDAGVVSPVAGGSSPLTTTVSRPDGQQDINGLSVTLPPGLLARIGSVAQCPDGAAAAGGCPAGSQIGRVMAESGAGSAPLAIPQAGKAPTAVYLTGPYKGAPYGLSIVVPAQAGPYDLGTVVVRAAIRVDPLDAHVSVDSDPIPTMLLGVPLNVQKINVLVDRPGLMVSPTNCDPMQTAARVSSVQGSTADVANRFQVGDCSRLALRPKLALSLTGKGQTTDGKHPAITANLTQTMGQANLKKVRVALPLSLALDPDNAQALCEFTDGSKVDPTCPKASIVGTATARTPILDQPLTGPVYFVKNIRIDAKSGRQIRTLPKLVIPLTGENGLKLTLTGTSAVENDQLVTTFDTIPDAPVSDFALNIDGGAHGILTVSGADVCKATQIAEQQIQGQNGKTANANITIQTPACTTKIITKKITAKTVVLKIGGLGAGKVTVTGTGIKKTTKTITNATVATITAHRTKSRLGKIKVSFTPAGSKKAKTASATLR